MNLKSAIASFAVSGLIAISFILVFALPLPSAFAVTTTSTITGWLFPDSTHWNNGIGALIFPLAGVGLFTALGKVLDLEGDINVTLALVGLLIGSILSMLSLTGSSNSVLPFAIPIVAAVDLFLWIWQGGKG